MIYNMLRRRMYLRIASWLFSMIYDQPCLKIVQSDLSNSERDFYILYYVPRTVASTTGWNVLAATATLKRIFVL